jgi:dihydroorotate dehydrogenase (NAD+) catalytic subunit
MSELLESKVGKVSLRNPVICGAGEHVMTAGGIRAALATGAAAVVAKSFNESEAGKDQLDRTDYALLGDNRERLAWDFNPSRDATLACRSGLTRTAFAEWLETIATLDREAARQDQYVIASIILADLDASIDMARQVEQAGVRILEFNIGVPYGTEAAGIVSTIREADHVQELVAAVRKAVDIPLWAKITGQSGDVAALAMAAHAGGADAVVMMGRFLGLVPDIETQEPLLGTNLGIGGSWALPMTCYWLSQTRKRSNNTIPLVATNGVREASDVIRMMLAGANAVQLASVVFTNGFGVLQEAISTLESYLHEHDMQAGDLVGIVADKVKPFATLEKRPGIWREFVVPEAR